MLRQPTLDLLNELRLAGPVISVVLLAVLVPTLFTARTLNVYAVPAVRPVTSWLSVVLVEEMSAQLP